MLENILKRIFTWDQSFSKVRTLQEIIVDAVFNLRSESRLDCSTKSLIDILPGPSCSPEFQLA